MDAPLDSYLVNNFKSIVTLPYESGNVEALLDRAEYESERLFYQGQIFSSRLDFAQAGSCFRRVVEVSNNPYHRAYVLMCDAYNYALLGNYSRLNLYISKIYELTKCDGMEGFFAKLSMAQFNAAMLLHRPAKEYFSSAMEHQRRLGSPLPEMIRAHILHVYGKILICSPDPGDSALDFCRIAEVFFPAKRYPRFGAELYIEQALVLSSQKQWSAAEDMICRACRLLKPDDFMLPFAEYYTRMEQKLVRVLEEEWPGCPVMLQAFLANNMPKWIVSRNRMTGESLSVELTKREYDIAVRAAGGMSNKEIAAFLDISENTVKAYLKTIFEKTGITKRSQLAQTVYGSQQ